VSEPAPELADVREPGFVPDHRTATEDAMRAIRGEGPAPVVIDKRLGLALDLVLLC
jgi:hypothetical protein